MNNLLKISVFLLFFLAIAAEKTSSSGSEIVPLVYGDSAPELEIYRTILDSPLASYQHLADLVIMQRGEFDKYPSKKDRVKRVAEVETFDMTDIADPSNEVVRRGAVSKAIMNHYKINRGLIFMLTGAERYAIKDLQNEGLMKSQVSEFSRISGGQLIGIFNYVERKTAEINDWGLSPEEKREKKAAELKAEEKQLENVENNENNNDTEDETFE